MKRFIAAWCAVVALALQAQEPSGEDLARRAVHRRAVEAVLWGMPVVNFDLMLQAMVTSALGSPNQVVYWSRLPDWKNQTLTPNPDVIYLMPFFDTRQTGPMVLEIPPADDGVINGTVIGDLDVEHRLELQSDARVTGSIRYRQLQMDVGATVQGHLLRVASPAAAGNVVELGAEKAAAAERR
jgi:hypothetical protein